MSSTSGVTSQREDDKKPDIKPNTHINIKIKSQDGNEIGFRVRRNMKLKEVLIQFCDHQSIVFETVQFLVDGKFINGRQSPDQLEMEDGDEIDAMLHQVGA